jgi:hypothetical protein
MTMDERRELVSPRAEVAREPLAGPSTARLVFRFAVGGTALLGEWFGAALRAIDALPAAPDEPAEVVPAGGRAVLVGALSSAMRWRPPPAPIAGAARRAGGLLAKLPGAGFARRRYARAHARVGARLRRWAEEGVREQRAGQRLARRATPAFFELAAARFADSPEVGHVIEQQSQGLAASSVAELRGRAAQADGAVERVARRVLRRRPPP